MSDERDELARLLAELGGSPAEHDDVDALSTHVWRRIFGVAGEPVELDELARRAGMDAALAERLVLATGVPAPLVAEDVVLLETFNVMAELVGPEQALHLARVTGAAMARIADAGAAAMRVNWEAPLVVQTSYAGYLAASVEVIADLFPRLGVLFERLFRHLVARTSEQSYSLTAGRAATTMALTIGFADVVGFTPHAAAATAEDLAEVIEGFEGRVTEAVTSHGGRVVKFIGDEVMFAFEDTSGACRCALDLVAMSASEEIPEVRVGLARGEVLMRLGDLYGPVVNLAARLVAAAPPNTVLVTPEVADAAPAHRFEPQEPRAMKGLEEPLRHAKLEAPG